MDILKKTIEEAANKLGGKNKLAEYLGIFPADLSAILAGKRGLTPIAQDKLEEMMKLPSGTLRAASEIITEKKPEKRAYWEKKLMMFEKIAACLIIATVTNFVTPTPAKAAPMLQVTDFTLYIMSNCKRKIKRKIAQILSKFARISAPLFGCAN